MATITGTTGNDNLIGTSLSDTISGLAGNDNLNGLASADTLDGGTGTDTASYASSNTGVTVNLATNVNTGGHADGDTLVEIENIVGSNFREFSLKDR